MSLRGDLLDRPAPVAARLIAQQFLTQAQAAYQTWQDDPFDDGAVHAFRVALRRLRTTLKAYRPCLEETVRPKHVRKVHALVRATGAIRDAHVQKRWLEQQRARLNDAERQGASLALDALDDETRHQQALDAVAGFRKLVRRLSKALEAYPGISAAADVLPVSGFAEVAFAAVHVAAAKLLRRLSQVRGARQVRAAHRARIAGKQLRYVLEPLETLNGVTEALERLERLQDALGDLHDAHVLEARLSRWEHASRPGKQSSLRALRRRVRSRAQAAYTAFDRQLPFAPLTLSRASLPKRRRSR